jgi:hypothetical protein
MSYETIVFETEGEAIASHSTVADSRARAACSYTLPGVFVHALLGAAERPTLERCQAPVATSLSSSGEESDRAMTTWRGQLRCRSPAAGATAGLATRTEAAFSETDDVLIDEMGYDLGGDGFGNGSPDEPASLTWTHEWYGVFPGSPASSTSRASSAAPVCN